jgi:hypothetical protein
MSYQDYQDDGKQVSERWKLFERPSYRRNRFRAGKGKKHMGWGSDAHLYRTGQTFPQWALAGSTHPYAPLVGNAPKWISYVYDDGTS